MKSLLFASGDVGGARAILPVIRLAIARAIPTAVMANGVITGEGEASWTWLTPGEVQFDDPTSRPGAFIFAASLTDPAALKVARKAHAAGVRTIHVLDSWATYASRMRTDGQPSFRPDAYCVPDTLAARGAIDDGIPEDQIVVTGQPAFADVAFETSARGTGRPGKPAKLLLVSEPVASDQGRTRGYTEDEALGLILEALQADADKFEVSLLPHPRDDLEKVERFWGQARGRLAGGVLAQNGLGAIETYDAVAGMASVLLYRAWLTGLPVLSCQPGLLLVSLRQFGERPDITMIDTLNGAHERIQAWASALGPGRPLTPRPESRLHQDAAAAILKLAEDAGER